MFIHNFKYSLKNLFRNRALLFWTFAFPIILGTLFNMAFSNIEANEKLDIIDIAIIDNNYYNSNEIYKNAFKTLSNPKSEEQLFNIKYVSESIAKDLLSDKKISGYLLLTDSEPKIVVRASGINETILKTVVEEISSIQDIMLNVANNELNKLDPNETGNLNSFYASIYSNVLKTLNETNVNIKNISNKNLSYTMIEFYTLIAMTCMYGGILGMTAINNNLANMGNIGKRVSSSPISKGKIILGSALASYVTQIIGLAILFLYTIFVLKVDYGSNLLLVIILALAGSLAGLSLGIAVSTLIKKNENIKTGIIISITMLGSFLSGMMGITMKYIIDKNIPIINKINPVSMITDGLYSLYYYDTLNRYLFNVISLIIFAGLMILISIKSLRRQKYDSI